MKKLPSLTLVAALISAMNATATNLTFDRINYDDAGPTTCLGAMLFPDSYGYRVIANSYIPANYTERPDSTWFYGGSGGFTPHITSDFRLRNDSATILVTACRFGDLFEVFAGSSASTGEQFIEVTLTADPGYKVHLASFDVANKIGPRFLQHARVLGVADASLYDATHVAIDGGPLGSHTTFDNPDTGVTSTGGFGVGWTAQILKIRLDAPFDSVLYLTDPNEAQALHISSFGIDNIVFSEVANLSITGPTPVPVQCLADVPTAATDLATFLAQGGSVSGGCGSPTVALLAESTAGTCLITVTRTYRVTDACGTSADCTQNITVQDTTAPLLTCPANQIIHGGAGPVTFSATATDNCDPAPIITFDPPSGSTFAVGTTPVTCVAMDGCNNTTTCNFNVVVLGEPIAREDDFVIPSGAPVAISISALLANDGHSGGLPISFAGCDATTSQGLPITTLGSPATALIYPASYNADSFTYRITDGAIERTGTVRFQQVAFAPPPTDALSNTGQPPNSGSFLTRFRSSAAGTYVLERQAIPCPGGVSAGWVEIARQTTTGDSIISFLDGPLPCGALYRVRIER